MRPGTIAERVLACVRGEVADNQRVTLDSTIESLGADSLDKIEIAMVIETEFGIEIPDASIDGLLTPADYVAYVERAVEL